MGRKEEGCRGWVEEVVGNKEVRVPRLEGRFKGFSNHRRVGLVRMGIVRSNLLLCSRVKVAEAEEEEVGEEGDDGEDGRSCKRGPVFAMFDIPARLDSWLLG